jgi:membrane-bound ClpP family serine protease
MDFFLSPNIAYLVLVIGLVLSLMAIFTPGTGIFEIGALFALILAGYSVYNLPVNWWAVGILILGVFPFMIAVRRSRRLVYLVISIIAMIVGSVFLFPGEKWWQPAVNPFLAILVSLITAGYFWIAVRKIMEAEHKRPAHDLEKLIGKMGEARTDIHLDGTVQVESELWSAFSQAPIPNGSKVRIKKRDGFVLEVETVPALNPESDRSES